jgi:hypothetical protein
MAISCSRAPESFNTCINPGLIVGHPGHELRVFGWISEYKPRTYVLTDGSGQSGASRLPSTAQLLAPLGIQTDQVFGVISDSSLYRAILEQETAWFVAILNRITDSLIEERIDLVVADAMEGFNPAHDLCRILVDGGVAAVKRKTGRTISNYKFCLTEWERSRQEQHDKACFHFVLDDDALRRKIEAAQKYGELKDEVREAIALCGVEYFRIECLKEVAEPFGLHDYTGRPDYEIWGEQRVAEGTYESVIRYEQHVFPIIDAIRTHALGAKTCPIGAAATGS